MFKLSYYSAHALCTELPSGAGEISYYGLITRKGFESLQSQAKACVGNLPAVVVRLDTGLHTWGNDLRIFSDCRHAALALVVSSSMYELALQLARSKAADLGVRRLVFLPEQAQLAYQWAEHVVQSQPAKLLQLQP